MKCKGFLWIRERPGFYGLSGPYACVVGVEPQVYEEEIIMLTLECLVKNVIIPLSCNYTAIVDSPFGRAYGSVQCISNDCCRYGGCTSLLKGYAGYVNPR
jgi:hypothetical protein